MAELKLWDRALKIIAREHVGELLQLLFPDRAVRLIGTEENVELAVPAERVDFVHRIWDEETEQELLLHVEFQWQHRADIPRRMYTYSAALTQKFELPVLTAVVYLKPRQMPLPTAYQVRIGANVFNQFSYPVVRLWEYVAEIRSGKYRAFAPLLIALTKQPTIEMLTEERALIMQEPNLQKRAHLAATAVLLAERHFEKMFLWDFFSQEEVSLMDVLTKWKTEPVISELYKMGLQEGMDAGMRKGEQKGRRDTAREYLLFILTRRFGDVSLRVRRWVSSADITQLDELLTIALDVDTLAAFEAQMRDLMEQEE